MFRDLIDALRHWRKTPAITAVAVSVFAVGIGANLAIVAVLDALLLRPLPVEAPDELVRLVTEGSAGGETAVSLSIDAWDVFRSGQRILPAVFAAAPARFNLAPGGEARFVLGLYLSGNSLAVLDVPAARGRTLLPDDDVSGAAPVAMVSTALWQGALGGRADVVGRTMTLDGHAFTVVGVTPPGFFGLDVGRAADVVVPASAWAVINGGASAGASRWLSVFGRLGPGQTVDATSAALRAWMPALRAARWPDERTAGRQPAPSMSFVSAATGVSQLGRAYGQTLLVLLGAVAAVLLMASANLSALVLARHTDRAREIGVRLALGAGRFRIARALLVESVLLAAVGAALGVWLAWWLAGLLASQMTSPALAGLPASLPISVNLRLLAAAVLLALTSGTLAGLLPAWQAARTSSWTSMASAAHGHRSRPLELLVVGQLAVSLVLATGAAAGIRSFVGLVTKPTGLEPDDVLVAAMSGELSGLSEGKRFDTIEKLASAIGTIPGVDAASAGITTPLSGGIATAPLVVPGSLSPRADAGRTVAVFNFVLPSYFAAIGTPLVAGRGFDAGDGPGSPPVAIVNEAFRAEHFGRGDAVGRSVMLGDVEMHIVGVVADARVVSLKESRSLPVAFGLLTQSHSSGPIRSLRFVVRTDSPQEVRTRIAPTVRTVDPRIGIELTTMRDEGRRTIDRERLVAWLGGAFASLGLALASIGLYGTFAYLAVRRRGEIGLRMAVGAGPRDVMRLVLGEAGRLVVVGAAAGVGAAWGVARFVQSVLVDVDARDPRLLAAGVAVIALAAGLATVGPAWRASQTDPATALRDR